MKTIIALLLAIAIAVPAQAALDNSGFEAGDFTGWSTTSSFGGNAEVLDSYTFDDGTVVSAYDGTYMAMVGSETADSNFNIFNQVMQIGASGSELSFAYNFWSYDYAPWDSNAFSVLVNGYNVFTLGAGDIDTDGDNGSLDMTGWQEVTLDLTEYIQGEVLTISFMAGDIGDYNLHSGVFLDNVNLSSTPIPGAALLLGSGLLGLAGIRRKMQA